MHIASGASMYQTRTLEVVTDFYSETDGTWSLIRNSPSTRIPALAFIKTASTPNGHVEVHLAQYS
jgi:hypothetical protein